MRVHNRQHGVGFDTSLGMRKLLNQSGYLGTFRPRFKEWGKIGLTCANWMICAGSFSPCLKGARRGWLGFRAVLSKKGQDFTYCSVNRLLNEK